MIKRSGHTLRVATVFIILLLPAAVFGQYDYIDINNPFSRKIPMAIPAFAALNSDGTDPALFKKATEILTNSLDFTGFFNMIDRGAYLLTGQSGHHNRPNQFSQLDHNRGRIAGNRRFVANRLAPRYRATALRYTHGQAVVGQAISRYGG
jgi:hypothetical protein